MAIDAKYGFLTVFNFLNFIFLGSLAIMLKSVQKVNLDKNSEQIALGHRVLSALFTPKHK